MGWKMHNTRMMGREIVTEFLWGNLREGYYLGDLSPDEGIILK